MVIETIEQKTNVRYRNTDDFESYLNAIDIEYVSKNVTFNGCGFILNTLQFNNVNRSAYGRGTNYMKKFFEYHRQNCYIPTSSMCFLKCISYFTNKDYTEEIRDFIRNEKYRPGVMTSARIQSFRRKYDINIGRFDGTKINPPNMIQRKKTFCI